MLGSNFLLFYLMATNLSTEETGEEDWEGPHIGFGGGRNCLSRFFIYFIYFPPVPLRKHCSPEKIWSQVVEGVTWASWPQP